MPSSNACQSKQQEVRDFAAELVKVGAVDVILSVDGKHTLGQAVDTLDRGRLLIETGKGTVVSIAQGYGDLLDTLVDAAKDPAGAAAQLQQEAQQIKEAVEWAAQNPEKYDEIVAKAEQRLRDDLAAAIASGDEAAVGALLGSLAANFTPDPTRKAQSALKVLDEITLAKKADEVAKRADVDKVVSLPVGSKNNWDKTANGQLEPKTAYLLDNGHTYLTDTNGRVKEVGAERNGAKMDRNGYQQGCVGKCGEAGDEGGHLIAAALGGAGDRINIVPQASTLNRGDWRAMEREFAQALKEGKTVSMKIEVGYPAGGGERPSVFRVISVINGRAQAPKIFNQ